MKKDLQAILTAFSLLIFPILGFGQNVIHLKTRDVRTNPSAVVNEISSANPNIHSHYVIQFAAQPSAATVTELQNRGLQVLADIPSNSLLISVQGRTNLANLGVHHAEALGAADKTSPQIGVVNSSTAAGYFVVEFYSDVDMNQARSLLLAINGLELIQNPDLNPLHLLVHVTAPGTQTQVIAAITATEEVAYLFPASKSLASNRPSAPCIGALTTNGASVQSVPTYGDGWDGPGLGSATLTYVFSKPTAQLPAAAQQSEIQRAMAIWSSFVKVTWQQGTNPTGNKTVNILFATYDHGDGFPFDGPGGVLAHTFYPAPPNPEPLAGDMHLDDSESWHIGTDTDLFSVSLHELGHALGLGHSDNPADVMYPYYKMVTTLNSGDIEAIQTLYAAQTGSSSTPAVTPSTPAPTSSTTPTAPSSITPGVTAAAPAATAVTLTVNSTATSTTAATLALSGSAKGGTGAIAISWLTNTGASGTAAGSAASWTIASIPLSIGTNTITLTASSGTAKAAQSITVTRQATTTSTATGTKDTVPPSLAILTPSSSTTQTTVATYTVSGVASDNVGVTSVKWTTAFGASGTATGTTSWSASIPVLVGINTITIQAFDAAGNSTSRTVMITRD